MKIVLLHLVGTSYFPYTKILSNFRMSITLLEISQFSTWKIHIFDRLFNV